MANTHKEMIKLHIKCRKDDDKTEQLREMGIDTPGVLEYRPFRLDPDYIIGYYPTPDGGCFVMVNDIELTVSENFDELEKLLQ